MNTQVTVNIFGLKSSKNFENNVATLINNHINYFDLPKAASIYIDYAAVEMGSGYGHYNKRLDITIDGELFELKEVTTDSELYDTFNHVEEWNRTHSNRLKSFVLEMIEEALEVIENKLTQMQAK